MSQKFFGKSEVENLRGAIGKLFGLNVISSSSIPKNKIVVINDECSNFFTEHLKNATITSPKGWVWHDFTKLRPETIQKMRKCRKISLAKKNAELV